MPYWNSKISLRKKSRLTRYRDGDGEWSRAPLGLIIGMWAEVREVE
jgi:hypothetical protein